MGTQINTNQIKDDAVTAVKLASGVGGVYPFLLISETELSGAVASVNITSIPATYDGLLLIFEGLPATDQAELYLRMNGDSGAAKYWWAILGYDTGAATTTEEDASDSEIEILTANPGNDAGEAHTVRVRIENYANTDRTKMAAFSGVVYKANNTLLGFNGAGGWKDTSAIDQLTLVFAAGNIASGTVRLYGRRAS